MRNKDVALGKTESIFKALAHHTRMEILDLLGEKEALGLNQIAEELETNIKTTAEHCRRLTLAGLIEKEKKGREVLHRLTFLGRGMLTIAKRTKDLF